MDSDTIGYDWFCRVTFGDDDRAGVVLRFAALLIAFTCACGPKQAAIESAPVSAESELQDALDRMCVLAEDLMQSRDRRASQRLGTLNLTLIRSEHREPLARLGEGMQTQSHPIAGEVWSYEEMRRRAAESAARLECAALERMLAMVAAGEEDFAEEDEASFEQELARACEIAEEVAALGLTQAMTRARFSERIVLTATNSEFFQMFASIAAVGMAERGDVVRAFAEENGATGWQCLAGFVSQH